MSLPNPETVVTEERLNEFYTELLPYLGGRADAGFTPVGTIIAVMGNSAPTNYLACNGQTVNIADYPELANYFKQQFGSANKFGGDGTTTFKIPDLRGEFLRGTGSNGHSGQGNGAAVGTHQDATAHFLAGFDSANNFTITGYNTLTLNPDSRLTELRKGKFEDVASKNEFSDDRSKPFTSRPTNTSVLFCVATKNIYLNPSLDYSTDEKVVGTWIDSKPIYQKTIQTTVPTTTESGTVAAVDLDTGTTIETVISYNGMLTLSDSTAVYWAKMPTVDVGKTLNGLAITLTNNNSAQSNRKNKLLLRNYYTAWNGATLYVTLQYTKPSN